jgi:gliding motility-associated-like protein
VVGYLLLALNNKLTVLVKKFFILLSLIINTTILDSYGQLIVQPSNTTTNRLQAIVQDLVGEGVQVSNITCNVPAGSPLFGSFQEPSGQLGIRRGLLMTSGTISNSIGPNNSPSTTSSLNLPGDQSLTNLLGGDATYDACVIEFDIKTTSSQISFDYIFGSEEYLEYVGSSYNDVFAFLISGPGITGAKNIALVPSTTIPVAINNVNSTSNSVYYIDNGDGWWGSGTLVQYDGYTVKLKAVASVTPCATYHLKLAIADVGDHNYDSGVFIESGSLSGTEGLMINNVMAPDSLRLCPSQLPVTLQAGITNVPNYDWTRNGADLGVNNKFYTVTADGWYRVNAYLHANCYWTDSIKIIVEEDFDLITSQDTGVCVGGSTQLNVLPTKSSLYTYQWSGATLNNPTIANPMATAFVPTVYKVKVSNMCYSDSAEINVSIYPPPTDEAFGDTTICYGGSAVLSAGCLSQYSYFWSPGKMTVDSTDCTTIANPLKTTDFILSINNKGCVKKDTVKITVLKQVHAHIQLPIRIGQVPWKVKFRNISTGAVDYTWYFSGFDSTKIAEPTIDVVNEDYYEIVLKAINELGCIDYDTIEITAYKLFIPNLITPNGDGKNDFFEITNLGYGFDFEVYNRWGDRVYKKFNYKNEWGGEDLSDGVYYFKIYDPFQETDYKGWVQILR